MATQEVEKSTGKRIFVINPMCVSPRTILRSQAVAQCLAINKAAELKSDLILLDLAMPRLNGAEAACVVKKIAPNTPIILFTIYEDAVNTVARAARVDMVLSKSDGLTHLIERAHRLLNSGQN
jgi:DNA-binding NarL/FixJ family response regulator